MGSLLLIIAQYTNRLVIARKVGKNLFLVLLLLCAGNMLVLLPKTFEFNNFS
jgi:hypothetical protein